MWRQRPTVEAGPGRERRPPRPLISAGRHQIWQLFTVSAARAGPLTAVMTHSSLRPLWRSSARRYCRRAATDAAARVVHRSHPIPIRRRVVQPGFKGPANPAVIYTPGRRCAPAGPALKGRGSSHPNRRSVPGWSFVTLSKCVGTAIPARAAYFSPVDCF